MNVRSVLSVMKAYLRRLQRRIATDEIIVLGDSHVRVFEHWHFLLKYPLRYFDVHAVQGATASGLENPNSKTQAHTQFVEALGDVSSARILLMLGEVDAGFVIWYRAKKYGVPTSETFKYAIQSYGKFIDEVAQFGELLVISCPLPTIKDGAALGEVANLRKEVDASQEERTSMTLRFNREIERHCGERGLTFLNLDADSIGDDGVVCRRLINPRPTDHHYHKGRYARLIAEKVKPFLNGHGADV